MTEAQAILLVGGLASLVYTAIQIGDRLWGRKKADGIPGQLRACQYDHRAILEGENRMEEAIGKLADSQVAVLESVKAIATQDRHATELAAMRHQETMKALELIERRLEHLDHREKPTG
jgi:hypothetical protein